MLRKIGKILLALLGIVVVLVSVGAIWAANTPVPVDPPILDADSGTGSIAAVSAISGLLREFPPMNTPADNQVTDERAELGRQLFFDPILSAENDMSCATCHHPDRGFSNGEVAGRTGRNVPTLWNVGYAQFLQWDGSMDSLESQALTPLTHADEMAANLDEMASELTAIPAYQAMFDEAYGGDVSAETVTYALAAFQRTLVTKLSPFDRYAQGDRDALTPEQRRGLALFRSGATRCFECHAAPTFADDTFRVIGVPSGDLGRAAVADDGMEGAFKVPTLRNIALTAPYMHDGSMETLEEVVEFYADGGGRAHDLSGIDPFVSGFDLSEQEQEDMVAFLYALTDESTLPAIPGTALSGLPSIVRYNNPDRRTVLSFNTARTGGYALPDREPTTIMISPDDDVQAKVDDALPGDTILFEYGIYHERVATDVNGLTFEGIANGAGEYPIFDGQGTLSEAFIASGSDFKIGKLHVRNYTDNGILVEGAKNVHIYDIISEDTGTYGIYPTKSTNVLVERVVASGVNDAAIYAGQCRDVIVRDSEVFGSVLGIELENTLNGAAYNNYAHDNSLGIFVVVLPQLTAKISRNSQIYDNVVVNNNIPNFADEGMAAALVPPGVGILSLAADNVEIYNNEIRDHRTAGVAIFSLTAGFDINEIDVGPNPEDNYVHDNIFSNNGYDPVASVADLGIPVGDTLWDGSGWNNRFDEPDAQHGFPLLMPNEDWGMRRKRVHWHFLNRLVSMLE